MKIKVFARSTKKALILSCTQLTSSMGVQIRLSPHLKKIRVISKLNRYAPNALGA